MWSTFFSAQATPVQNRADQQHTNKAAERKRPLNPAKNSQNHNNQEGTHRKTPKTQYTIHPALQAPNSTTTCWGTHPHLTRKATRKKQEKKHKPTRKCDSSHTEQLSQRFDSSGRPKKRGKKNEAPIDCSYHPHNRWKSTNKCLISENQPYQISKQNLNENTSNRLTRRTHLSPESRGYRRSPGGCRRCRRTARSCRRR